MSIALEALRNRPIVAESREYARRWERSSARAASLRVVMFVSAGTIAAAGMLAYLAFSMVSIRQNGPSTDLIETRIGETRAITLSDGSRLVLDTTSRARVVFTWAARDIELLDGQAHFEVARDPVRPFRVRTGSAEVVAIGTTFDVAATSTRTTVTLEVFRPPGSLSLRARDRSTARLTNAKAWQ